VKASLAHVPHLVNLEGAPNGGGSAAGGGGGSGEEGSGGVVPSPALGRLLLRLLRYYGEDFDPAATGLCVQMGGPVPLQPLPLFQMLLKGSAPHSSTTGLLNPQRVVNDPLTLPDPLDADQNVGRNCFRFFQVQQAFAQARTRLLRHCEGQQASMLARERRRRLALHRLTSRLVALQAAQSAIQRRRSSGAAADAGGAVDVAASTGLAAAAAVAAAADAGGAAAAAGLGDAEGEEGQGGESPQLSPRASRAIDAEAAMATLRRRIAALEAGMPDPEPHPADHAARALGDAAGSDTEGADAEEAEEGPAEEFPLLSRILPCLVGL
jgi:hypothetical protein